MHVQGAGAKLRGVGFHRHASGAGLDQRPVFTGRIEAGPDVRTADEIPGTCRINESQCVSQFVGHDADDLGVVVVGRVDPDLRGIRQILVGRPSRAEPEWSSIGKRVPSTVGGGTAKQPRLDVDHDVVDELAADGIGKVCDVTDDDLLPAVGCRAHRGLYGRGQARPEHQLDVERARRRRRRRAGVTGPHGRGGDSPAS